MVIAIAVAIVAVGFVVLVAYLVPVLVQVRKTIAASEQLLTRLNTELPALLGETRAAVRSVNELVEQTRGGVEHAAALLHAVGDVGETVQQVHDTIRGTGSNLLLNVASMVAGFKAASAVFKDRVRKEGGDSNGG